MKKKLLTLALASSFIISPIFLSSSIASASEVTTTEESDGVVVTKNEQYLKFEAELLTLQKQQKNEFSSRLYTDSTKEAATNLIEKYEGAEISVAKASVQYTCKFVNGGLNSFATTKTGLQQLRTDLATTATLLLTNGTLGGATIAGPLGALVGLVGGGILGQTARGASNTMQSWINAGSSKGGVRITIVEQFAISNINSQTQAKIKKL
ncbi:hypothetical protein [Enterococcus sp. RIT-PI-f]|uniref:hypothetical protein n=1 Tax=Enterococcus sp. RIT-PI-f TaxID=1690244 RepID=UPI0006B91ED4|nr:hypothetical protein [Enterococcus sp. RIT-PI-f]KPG72200.1 hypothetical protein AEQ18_02355 [Enterococcus sp. RIT-PI-f]